MNILFYSRECNACRNLLKILKNENLLSYFKLFCVDDRLDEVPKQITIVPTMIVSNINKPLVAQEAFEWVQKIKFIRQQQQQQFSIKNDQINQEPIGYIPLEMDGISDQFAYSKIDRPLVHNYFQIGDEKKHVIYTAPEQYKISKDEQLNRIKDIEKKRAQQEMEYSKIMKEQQLKAVLSSKDKIFE